jgi:DNA polymerase
MMSNTPKRSAEEFFPRRNSLSSFRKAASGCRACDLWKEASQTVFGEGSAGAEILFIGEQPGNEEDLSGRPFVGPAGRLLDEALAEAGIDRAKTYLTNTVKHFKYERRGKKRIHDKPNARERAACRPWLNAEIFLVKPKVIVCLGATAAQALLGPQFRVTRDRGRAIESSGRLVVATVHPASILRMPDAETRERERKLFIEDLKTVARLVTKTK